MQMLVHLMLSQRSLRLSSFLFILFSIFCLVEVVSTILSSSSFIYSSASVILLLIPSNILFISVCFFFSYSKSLVNISCMLLALLPPGPWWPSLAGPALHTYPRALLNPVRADPLPTPTCWTGRLDSWALRSFLPPPNCVTLATLLNLFEA